MSAIPDCPGIYRFYDETGQIIYVGKAKSLRRRLNQYRNAKRKKRDRKMLSVVKDAVRFDWQTFPSELEASLEEVRWIQRLRPRWNVAGAFSFLYPMIGLKEEEGVVFFCFTTTPALFPHYQFHGAYRSRELTREAFFALMRLLPYVGHPVKRKQLGDDADRDYSHVFGFRRLPEAWASRWELFFRGEKTEALEWLIMKLVENAGARARAAELQEQMNHLKRFWKKEALPLKKAIEATSHVEYPVSQESRDLVFLRYRQYKKETR